MRIRIWLFAALIAAAPAARAEEVDNPYGEKSIFSRPRASALHDRVTVSIDLKDTAKTEAKTDVSRDTELKWSISKFFLDTTKKELPKPSIDMTSSRTHDTDGKTETAATVKTEISGTVISVLPNGHLVIEARRRITINNEERTAVFAGRIDPADLSETNTVDFKYVIDPVVQLIGKGDVSDLAKRGWLSRTLDRVNPF